MNVRLSRFIVLVSLVAALSGCGDKKKPDGPEISGVTITGKLLQNGKPFKILPDETIKIVFMSAEGEGKVAGGANVKEDSTFEIIGPSGKGLPAGNYKVSLNSEIYGGSGTDRFAEKFEMTYTPFLATVAAGGPQNFELDLDTGKVVKK